MAIEKKKRGIRHGLTPFQTHYQRFKQHNTIQAVIQALYRSSENKDVYIWGHGGLCTAYDAIDKLIDEKHFNDMLEGDTSDTLIDLKNKVEELESAKAKAESECEKLTKQLNSDRMTVARAGRGKKKEDDV